MISGILIDYPDVKTQLVLIAVEEPEPTISPDFTKEKETEEFKEQQAIFLKQIEPILMVHKESPLT